jgi:hypothetical protein
LGIGSISSVGVPERCRRENGAREFIICVETGDFFLEEGAPFGRKAIVICLVGFTQKELAPIILRKPKPGGDEVVNVLKSPMVKAKPGRRVRIDLDQPRRGSGPVAGCTDARAIVRRDGTARPLASRSYHPGTQTTQRRSSPDSWERYDAEVPAGAVRRNSRRSP